MLGKLYLDCPLMWQKRARSLEPAQRRSKRRAFHLRDVIGVIQAHRDQLRRRDRQRDFHFREFSLLTGWFNVDPIRFGQNLDIFVANFAVGKFSARSESAKRPHASISLRWPQNR